MTNYNQLILKQRDFFFQGKTKEISFRLESLYKLKKMIQTNEPAIMESLKADLNKSNFYSYLTEIGITLEEINYTIKHLKTWAKPRKVKSTLPGSKGYIYPEPYGVTLIVSPWNYPFQLAIAPLIGAIAAGNCTIIKPSELTPNTSTLLTKLISNEFSEEYIAVVEGGVETSQVLLKEKFDYIFFTGSVPVGKVVMEAASKHLTPITLELGGKSPCIVHKDANLKMAAKRIAWGKYTNAGQTCIAPDYVFVHHNVKDKFNSLLKESIKELFGEDVFANGDFTRIVSEKHFKRLSSFLNNGTIVMGGKHDINTLTIEPTVLEDITWEDEVMKDEIFGPILPIMEYDDLSSVFQQIQERPKPLALYIFSESSDIQHSILNNVSYGGGCINDTLTHLSTPHLPFGGVGESGIGSYHGKSSFDAFSHEKSILKQTTLFDIPFRYPNSKNALKIVRKFLG